MADNVEALDQILPKLQEDPEYEFSGRLGEVQKEWLDLVERRREKERIYQDAKRAVNAETSLVSKSVVRQVAATDLSGEVSVTKLLMNLKAKDQEGELPYTVTLRKYDLTTKGSDRLETARWIITDIEGANDEARAAVEAYRSAGPITARSEPARERSQPARERDEPARQESAPAPETVQRSLYRPKELRGLARVQILAPETKIQGNDVVSTVRVRNASKDWITRFTATEYWYDEAGTATRGGSKTHDERFMPGDVIELELRTRKNENFFQNQFEFSHANGEVDATLVTGFPQSD
jgi:hypothetical protein